MNHSTPLARIALLAPALLLLRPADAPAQSADSAAFESMAAKRRDGRLLLLHAAEFDPLDGAPTLPAALTWDGSADPDYFLVQFHGSLSPADRALLSELGATPLHFVPNHAWLVRADAAALAALGASPRVRARVAFEPAFRLDPALLPLAVAPAEAPGGAAAPIELFVQLFRGCDTGAATGELALLGVALDDVDAGLRERLLVRAPAASLAAMARVRDVQWIAPRSQLVRRGPMAAPAPIPNDTTNWVIQSNASGSTPVWDNGVLGDGVIIGHIDGAIDLDACWFDDPNVSSPGPTHRKVVAHHGSSSSPDGHGTHTAGTAAGDQEPVNGVLDANGVGYRARLAHTNDSLVDSGNFKTKLEELHADGATIFTNSWGDDFTTQYNAWCVDIDELTWEHPETLICFAVSNLSDLKNPENAKNVLAVGATGQSPNQASHCTGGQGPTDDGRRKPELYAPGCNIESANDNRTCSTTSMSGTSMACPAIAGAAALTKSYFEAGYWPSGAANAADAFVPSGSLLKATLLVAGRDLTSESGYPTNLEGWGRLHLDHSLHFAGDARSLWLADPGAAGAFAATGEQHDSWIHVHDNVSELNFCLVFADAPGALNSNSPVVNDLDLEITAPGGNVYRGNVFSSGASATGGAADPLNNVERIRLVAPPLGWYAVRVRATDINSAGAQPYALVATGNLDPPADGSFTTYGSGTPGTGGRVPAAALSGSPQLGGDVTLTLSNGRGGAPVLLIVGFARAAIPFAGGQLLVATPWIEVTAALDGTPGVAGVGDLALSDTVPDDPALVGLVVDFQALVADPAAQKKFALSNGAELTIGS